MTRSSDLRQALAYIDQYWEEITFYLPEDQGTRIGLPHPFVAPNADIFAKDQFYWDTYFTLLGLTASGRVELARGMVDNLVYLYRRFNIIPSRNRFFNVGISQPPLLTSMALEVHEHTGDTDWLLQVAAIAKDELAGYWMDEKRAESHLAYAGLSRYCDHYITHLTAEHETGWDMTSRFADRCLDFLPIDLNALLYKYETDLAHIARLAGNEAESDAYEQQAKRRRLTVDAMMWNEAEGFYYDYDYQQHQQSSFASIAGFYPLWAQMATAEQAARLRENLERFECAGGLVNTQPHDLSDEFKQHDYPNGWPMQQWIVIQGLRNYGYFEDAERLARKWLDLNCRVFAETGQFHEKYDVVNCSSGRRGSYPHQTGFGWSNAVFVRLARDYAAQELPAALQSAVLAA